MIGSRIYLDDVANIFREKALWLIGITLAVTALIGAFLMALIRGIIPLTELKTAMVNIQTNHDLSQHVRVASSGEIGASFNAMIQNFQSLIHQVASGIQEVTRATAQLSASSQQVAISSNQQSDAAAAMSAAVEEMTVSMDNVAKNSQDTYSIAQQSGELSAQGAEVVQDAVAECPKSPMPWRSPRR